MIDPNLLCNQHLLGEHVECHMLVGNLLRNHSIRGYVVKQIIEPQNVKTRHDALAQEMLVRKMNHKSELVQPQIRKEDYCQVDHQLSIHELCKRCPRCSQRINRTGY